MPVLEPPKLKPKSIVAKKGKATNLQTPQGTEDKGKTIAAPKQEASLEQKITGVQGILESRQALAESIRDPRIATIAAAQQNQLPSSEVRVAAGLKALSGAKPEKESVKESTIAQAAAGQETVAKTPEEDPNFQALKAQITQTAKGQQQHGSSAQSVKSAQAAAPIAGNEQKGAAQEQQVAIMDAQEAGTFSASDFKAQLKGRIATMQLPENEAAADKFEENNNINEVNDKALGDVSNSKNAASGAIANSTAAPINTAAVTKREVKALPTPNYGKKPTITGVSKAMPAIRGVSQVEQPLKEQHSAIDSQMEAHGVTDSMLANSNEASFTGALAEKNTAKTQSASATAQFRSQEEKDKQTVESQAQQETQSQVSGMHTARSGALNKVTSDQKGTADKNSLKRKEIASKIDSIYTRTKSEVDTLLVNLDTEVAAKFTAGSKNARLAFENHVATEMTAYKKERYGDSFFDLRQLRRVGDVFGLPKEVNKIFVTGRDVYIKAMDSYINDIANLVASKLNEAKRIIASGKTEVKTYVDSLSPELQKLGKEAASSIEGKFDHLEQAVDGKKENLIDTLAEKYAEQVASVDARVDELKAANAGLVGKALGALQGVFDFVIKIKATLTNLLSKIVAVVTAIITDPIGFFKNLIAGVGQGISNFGANIMTHLKTGFMGWLTGAMKGVSFTMPEDVFSLKGIFSITMQVLNLGWQGIRGIGAKVIGEPVMKAIETGVEIVQIIRKDGVAGLWEHLKEQFQDLKATVMDAVMSMIQTQVIQAGIKWILGLLSPVGAFVKAALAIVDVVKFFMQRAAQIAELVDAFVNSVAAIASGKVGAVAKAIEGALGKAVPVLIGLLASILGIGGITDKVLGLIRKIRKRITVAITNFWIKVKKGAGKLLRRIGFGKKKEKKGDKDSRTSKEKQQDLSTAKRLAERELEEGNKTAEQIRKDLPKIKDQYDLTEIELINDGENKFHIHLEINPKDDTKQVELKSEEEGDLIDIYNKNKSNIHPSASKDARTAFDAIQKDKKGKKNRLKWSGLLKLFKDKKPTKDLHDNPIANDREYGKYVHQQFENAAAKVMPDASETEKENAVKNKKENLKDSKHVYTSLRDQVFDKDRETKSNERLESLFKGEEGEHDDYKVLEQTIDYIGTAEGVLVVNYNYVVQKGDEPKETKTFKVTLQQEKLSNGIKGIKHKIEGFNLAIKEPGTRGKTDSAVNERERKTIQEAQVNNPDLIKQIKNSEEGELDTKARKEKRDQFKGQADDTTIKFNASHLIADWFQGSGYSLGLNLVNTSEHYNKQIMFEKETDIVKALKFQERKYVDIKKVATYITFDMVVEAEWMPITDNKIEKLLKEGTKKQAGETNKQEKERLEDLHKTLAKDTDPKFCNKVEYEVLRIHLKDQEGNNIDKPIENIDIFEEIGQDTSLKDVLKNQN